MFSQKTGNLLLLGLFFVLGVVIPLVVMPLKDGGDADFTNLPRIVFTLLQVPVFVFYIYYVYPRFLVRKRVSTYLTTVVLTCLLITMITTGVGFLSGTYELYPRAGNFPSLIPNMVAKFFTALVIAATATCYAFLLDMLTGQRLEKQLLRSRLLLSIPERTGICSGSKPG